MREYGNTQVAAAAGFPVAGLRTRLLAVGCEVICVGDFYSGTRGKVRHVLENSVFEVRRRDVTFPLTSKPTRYEFSTGSSRRTAYRPAA